MARHARAQPRNRSPEGQPRAQAALRGAARFRAGPRPRRRAQSGPARKHRPHRARETRLKRARGAAIGLFFRLVAIGGGRKTGNSPGNREDQNPRRDDEAARCAFRAARVATSRMDHQAIKDLLPLAALDRLEPDEARELEEHLRAGCDECEAELRELREVAASLALSLEQEGSEEGSQNRIWERL